MNDWIQYDLFLKNSGQLVANGDQTCIEDDRGSPWEGASPQDHTVRANCSIDLYCQFQIWIHAK